MSCERWGKYRGQCLTTTRSSRAASTTTAMKVGSMLLTLVDPHKGFEGVQPVVRAGPLLAGCMIGPYIFAGSADGCDPGDEGPAVAADAVASPLDAGSYVAIYWLEKGHHAEHWDAWALTRCAGCTPRPWVQRAHARAHGAFDHVGADYRDADPVPVELALDHGYDAIVGVWLTAAAVWMQLGCTRGSGRRSVEGAAGRLVTSRSRRRGRRGRSSATRATAHRWSLDLAGGQENRLCRCSSSAGMCAPALPRFRAYTDRLEL